MSTLGISPAERITGAVIGAAVGDALGHPTEFLSLQEIRRRFGEAGVTTYELFWEQDGKRFAPYTDDTQMAEVVLRGVIEARRQGWSLDLTMSTIAQGFVEWARNPQGGHRAPGNACLAGSRALAGGAHWSEAGGAQAGGCGSVMRAYPFGLAFAEDLERAEAWAVDHSKLTHRDPIALAACASMAVGMATAYEGESVGRMLERMVEAAGRHDRKTAEMIEHAIEDAEAGIHTDQVLERLQGWAAHEAIAAAAYVIARHPDDFRAAVLEGVNSPGDSDSIGTLAGALLGARCGISSIPPEWVNQLERTEELRHLAAELVAVIGNRDHLAGSATAPVVCHPDVLVEGQ